MMEVDLSVTRSAIVGGLMVGAILICAGWSDAALAERPAAATPPQTLSWFGDPGSPDVSGVWARADGNAADASREGWTPWPPPLIGEFAKTWQNRVAQDAAGTRTDDPVVACLPAGMPRYITGMNGPLLIVQTPRRVSMSRDYGPPRRVWLDGRSLPAPEEVEQFFAGNSVGRYEGGVLVVDTIGVKNQPIDSTGVPHSDEVKIEERYQRIDAATLRVQVTVTDALALSKPMRTVVSYRAITDPLWELQDRQCVPKTGYFPELFVK